VIGEEWRGFTPGGCCRPSGDAGRTLPGDLDWSWRWVAERIALYPLIIWLVVFGLFVVADRVRRRSGEPL